MAATLRLFGWIVVFFGAAAVLILAVILATRAWIGEGDAVTLAAIFTLIVVLTAAFVPYLNWAMRRSFVHEPASVPPLDAETVRARLRALTGLGAPVEMEEVGGRMRFRWRYLDAELRGILEKRAIRSAYELQIRLDPGRHEAILTDVKRSLRFGVGARGVSFGLGYTRGHLAGVEIGRGYSIDSDLTVKPAMDYRFSPGELKRPVLHELAQAGWRARFAMW